MDTVNFLFFSFITNQGLFLVTIYTRLSSSGGKRFSSSNTQDITTQSTRKKLWLVILSFYPVQHLHVTHNINCKLRKIVLFQNWRTEVRGVTCLNGEMPSGPGADYRIELGLL